MSEDNKLIIERKKKLEELSSLTKLYPNSFKRNTNSHDLRQKFDKKNQRGIRIRRRNIFCKRKIINCKKDG